MRVLAPAKINLHLHVGKRRDDGFHPLHTWMCTVGLFDKLTFERARPGGPALTCNWPEVPTDQGNLVLRAASALAATSRGNSEHPEVVATPLTIRLEKAIPHGAGLGGGSSDAARTLLALNRLWKLDFGKDQLLEVAARLGSDLPFFLGDRSAIARGRGEMLETVRAPRARYAVLVLPEYVVSTPAVYRRFDEMDLGGPLPEEEDAELGELDSRELLERLTNHLEVAAFSLVPQLRELRCAVEAKLGRVVRMSGSGSSLFTLFDEEGEAKEAAKKVKNEMSVGAIPVEVAPEIRDDLHEDLTTR